MARLAFVWTTTALLANVGCYMGLPIHGPTWDALIPIIADGAGGFGSGCAGLDVLRRWRAARA